MRPPEVVFNKPFSEATVKYDGISMEIPIGEKLSLRGLIEPSVVRVVFRRFNSAVVLGNAEVSGCLRYGAAHYHSK